MLPSTREGLESVNRGESRASSGRLSVAQRARLDAENRSNSHRSQSPTPRSRDGGAESSSLRENNNHGQQQQQQTRGNASISSARLGSVRSNESTGSQQETLGRSGSFFQSLGKAIEKAVDNSVLGVPLDESYDDEAESQIASSVISEPSMR